MKRRFHPKLAKLHAASQEGDCLRYSGGLSPQVTDFELPFYEVPGGFEFVERGFGCAFFASILGAFLVPAFGTMLLGELGKPKMIDASFIQYVVFTAIGFGMLIHWVREALITRRVRWDPVDRGFIVSVGAWPNSFETRYRPDQVHLVVQRAHLIQAGRFEPITWSGDVLMLYFPDQAIALAALKDGSRIRACAAGVAERFGMKVVHDKRWLQGGMMTWL